MNLPQRTFESHFLEPTDLLLCIAEELRQNLGRASGSLRSALDEASLSKPVRTHLDEVWLAFLKLQTFAGNLQDLGLLAAQGLRLEEQSFQLIDCLVDTAGSLGIPLECKVTEGTPARVKADPGRLRQLFSLLLARASRGQALVLCVLPDQQQVRFELEEANCVALAARRPQDRLKGSLCRAIVEQLGGRLELLDCGSFRLWLPLAAVEQQSDLSVGLDLEGASVLLADRTEAGASILATWLVGLGLICDQVNQPAGCLERVRQHPPEFLVVDLNLGGFDFVARLRQEVPLTTHLIVTTGRGERGDAARCLELSVSAYLTRPLQVEDLYLALALVRGQVRELVTRHTLREARNA
ncbi:MAG: response regulator [Vulcanimicrobiota bacterium]